MRSVLLAALAVFTLGSTGIPVANAQNSTAIAPLQVGAGTVVTFYSQRRLKGDTANTLDLLPRGTALKVKMLEPIDSNVDRDGLEFRGSLAAPLVSGNDVLVHSDADVRGIFVLLRSKSHPDGFRYELLITSVSENGRSYEMTASLNPSFFDGPATHPVAAPAVHEGAKESETTLTRLPLNNH